MLTTVLFDLDGTLLPMDQDVFLNDYLKRLGAKLALARGYDPKLLISAVWKGSMNVVNNDGSETNERVFWDSFCNIFGEKVLEDLPVFEEFYEKSFDDVAKVCGYNKRAGEIVELVKAIGLRVVLATNPVFPRIATHKRIRWAGLEPEDFELVTTYENSTFCKPNTAYYSEIINKLGVKAEECLMVGNDADDDMAAHRVGMRVFLLTDCLINKSGVDVSLYPHGGFDELEEYVKSLI